MATGRQATTPVRNPNPPPLSADMTDQPTEPFVRQASVDLEWFATRTNFPKADRLYFAAMVDAMRCYPTYRLPDNADFLADQLAVEAQLPVGSLVMPSPVLFVEFTSDEAGLLATPQVDLVPARRRLAMVLDLQSVEGLSILRRAKLSLITPSDLVHCALTSPMPGIAVVPIDFMGGMPGSSSGPTWGPCAFGALLDLQGPDVQIQSRPAASGPDDFQISPIVGLVIGEASHTGLAGKAGQDIREVARTDVLTEVLAVLQLLALRHPWQATQLRAGPAPVLEVIRVAEAGLH